MKQTKEYYNSHHVRIDNEDYLRGCKWENFDGRYQEIFTYDPIIEKGKYQKIDEDDNLVYQWSTQ